MRMHILDMAQKKHEKIKKINGAKNCIFSLFNRKLKGKNGKLF